MDIRVEPSGGPELDRFITALLNVTGLVSTAIEDARRLPYADGVEVIGRAADRLRGPLAFVAEHHSDEELSAVTQILAEAALITAHDMDVAGPFYPEN